MLQHPCYLLPDLLQVPAGFLLCVHPQTQRHGTDKRSADFLQLPLIPARHRRSHKQLLFPRSRGKQDTVCSQEQHVGRNAILPAPLRALAAQFPGNAVHIIFSLIIKLRWTCFIRRQKQRLRQRRQMLPPVVPVSGFFFHSVPGLPISVVQIIHVPRNSLPALIAAVQPLQHQGRAHPVPDNMMHIQEKELRPLPVPPQARPQQGRFIQGKRPDKQRCRLLQGIPFKLCKRKSRLRHYLCKNTIILLDKGRTEYPFPGNQPFKCLRQPSGIHRLLKTKGSRHVIGEALRRHAGLDINSLLDGSQGITVQAGRGLQLPHRLFHRFLFPADVPGQTSCRTAGIQIGNPQPPSHSIFHSGKHLHGIQGIPAAQKIVAFDSHLRLRQHLPENLQDLQ